MLHFASKAPHLTIPGKLRVEEIDNDQVIGAWEDEANKAALSGHPKEPAQGKRLTVVR